LVFSSNFHLKLKNASEKMDDQIKVLVVDDNSDFLFIIKQLFIRNTKFNLSYEKNLASAITHINKEKFDCILLDLNLPDSEGICTFKSVQTLIPEIPIVILTVIDDNEIALEALKYGAQDYLIKGDSTLELISRSIRYAIERKKLENALKESEKKYREITETILEGLWLTDSEGKTTYINKQLANMLGYSIEEILNIPFFNFVNKDFQDQSKEFFERRKKGLSDQYDILFDKKDGSKIWSIVSASPLYDEQGKFSGAMGLITNITHHKMLEESLEKSVQEWYSTFNAIRDAICITNNTGKIIRYNESAKKLFRKFSSEEITKTTCIELIECNFTDRTYEEHCPIIKMLKSHQRETRVIRLNNNWFYCSVDPLLDYDNNIIGGVHILADITKYKVAQDALKEGEERWRMLTENSPEYILIIDNNNVIKFANRSLNINEDRDKIIGTSIYKYIPIKFKSEFESCIEKVKKTKKPESIYIEYLNVKGNIKEIKYFLSNISPITAPDATAPHTDSKNEVTGFIISSSDITDRKRIEDDLRESEERYRTIIQYSNDAIWTLDKDGKFTFFNRRAEKLGGFKLEDMKGKQFQPFIFKEDLPKASDTFKRTLQGQPQELEVTFTNAQGKLITLLTSRAPIYSRGQVVGTVNFGKDITEYNKAQEKIRRTTEELERSNKELEQFAYIASHDLQEPLRSISSFTELLAMRYKNKLDEDADQFMEYILSGTKRMQHMINDLLVLSRVGTKGKEFQYSNIRLIIDDVLKNLHSMIQRNKAIILIEDMPAINVDDGQFRQLFQNLIENAIKFRKKNINPEIVISSHRQKILSNIHGEDQKFEWVFSVKDNGIGIDPRDFPKLFIIFHRLNKRDEYSGTGMGLAICKKIVDRHNGRIWIDSKPGEGSIFYFSIPEDLKSEK
jgi:PAS domain S-box-containing protein